MIYELLYLFCDWPESLLWLCFYNSQVKTALFVAKYILQYCLLCKFTIKPYFFNFFHYSFMLVLLTMSDSILTKTDKRQQHMRKQAEKMMTYYVTSKHNIISTKTFFTDMEERKISFCLFNITFIKCIAYYN